MIADGKFVDLLKQLKSIGVDQIELCGYLGGAGYPEFKSLADARTTRTIIEDNGLKAVSCHFLFPELRDNLAKAIAWSKDLGLEQIMVPTVKSGATTGTLEEAKLLTDQFNKMAVDINKAGMRAAAPGKWEYEVEAAIEFAERSPLPQPQAAFEDLFL